jgi:hypothetical protein
MDRQDIDALLIGALYGELTPADEARLAAHLESHPADKSALEGMKATRDSVRASRIFEVQTDPPQAVSALLLQEAARRAPRRAPEPEARESWFHRFVRSFMAHPAMAAAAMLVLVVGVAGTLYMRHGDQFAEKTMDQAPAASTERADNVAMPPPAETAAQGSSYDVGLAEQPQVGGAKDAEKAEAPKLDRKVQPPKATATASSDGDNFAKAPRHSKKGYVEVTTPDRMPKDLDKNDEGGEIAGNALYGRGAPGAGAAATNAPAPPPPPPPQVAQAPMDDKPVAPSKPAAPAPSKTVAKAPAQEPTPQPQTAAGPATDRGLYAWAAAQHRTAVEKAKKGDCAGAATLAVQVKTRDPDYYAQYMKGDRELKGCNAYIDDAQMRNESANSKQKATKRASDEPASPTRK